MHVMPSALLRSALFSASRTAQANWRASAEGEPKVVVDKRIATTNDMTIMLSGFELCQFDRHVYSTCFDFYRDLPLAPNNSDKFVETTFFAFTKRMGGTYGVDSHAAVRASLLRLSRAQIRIRSNRVKLELPKLLSTTIEGGAEASDYKGSDRISMQIPASIAELFGVGAWSAIDSKIARSRELKGWLVCFYGTHSAPKPLPLSHLYRMCGYESSLGQFQTKVQKKLTELKETKPPFITSFKFDKHSGSLVVQPSPKPSGPVMEPEDCP